MKSVLNSSPSSGALRHLLPQGEKGGAGGAASTCFREVGAGTSDLPSPLVGKVGAGTSYLPSPLVGEGGSRSEPGEGALFVIADEHRSDRVAREALLDRAMGTKRKRKSSEKLRRGRLPAAGLPLVARDGFGALIGTVRLWHISAGTDPSGNPVPALLLGPLAVDPSKAGQGMGSALMREAIMRARALGHGAILLMGDPEYYARFGFSSEKTGCLAMPGPYEQRRFLALELAEGALDGAAGVLVATGERKPERAAIRAA